MEPKQISIEELDSTWIALKYDDLIDEETYLCPDRTWRKANEDGTIPAERFSNWKTALETLHELGETDTLLAEYRQKADHPPEDLAKKILFDLMEDLTDRRGIRMAWDETESVDQEEILAASLKIIRSHLPSP